MFILLRRVWVDLVCVALLTGCGIPAADPGTAQGKRAILGDVNVYLSSGQCPAALNELTPLYNSANTDNDVRMAMASVYSCFAGLNMFNFASSLVGTNTAVAGFPWSFFATSFPSVALDKKVESAGFAVDSVMAMLNAGEVLIPGDLFNATTNNPGSILLGDRTVDANFYLFFAVMPAIGGEESRQGANANGTPVNAAQPLPWITSATSGMSSDGCAYASAVVNFADALASMPTTGYLGTAISKFNSFIQNYQVAGQTLGKSFSQLIYDACVDGCTKTVPRQVGGTVEESVLNTNGAWSNATCGINTACTSCPLLLRNRNNCAGTANDQVSCAAAGVINFINQSVLGWH